MTKIIGYTLMIVLAGGGAALSSLMGGLNGMWRGFILGSVLALSIAIGDYFASRNKLRNNLIQGIIGILAGLAAAILILNVKLDIPPNEIEFEVKPESLLIFLCVMYGLFFQWIIMSNKRIKFLKLFLVSFLCIFLKFNYGNGRFDIKNAFGISVFVAACALIFVVLWYLPVWFFYVRKHSIISYLMCIPLNLRMLKLILAKRWLSKQDYAISYDKVAATYDEQWLCQLRPITEKLLAALPQAGDGDILDLGCGTGMSTLRLEKEFLKNPVIAVDISPEMLNVARKKCLRTEFIESDILEFMKKRPDNSASLIFSGWAVGYSNPAEIIFEARRILKSGGAFAFVVNYSDTLASVFYAFRKCMNKFPGQVKMALWPRFPHESGSLLKQLKLNGLSVQMQEDGRIPIHSPEGEITLEWLLKTGVLAGFDQMMPLHDNPELIEYFNKALRESNEPVEHHYFMGVFIKK